MKHMKPWDITLYNLVDIYQCFERTYYINILYKYGGSRFLRNVDGYLPNYKTSR